MRTADMPVIELRGPGRERGRQYGETLKAEIARLLERVTARCARPRSAAMTG